MATGKSRSNLIPKKQLLPKNVERKKKERLLLEVGKDQRSPSNIHPEHHPPGYSQRRWIGLSPPGYVVECCCHHRSDLGMLQECLYPVGLVMALGTTLPRSTKTLFPLSPCLLAVESSRSPHICPRHLFIYRGKDKYNLLRVESNFLLRPFRIIMASRIRHLWATLFVFSTGSIRKLG